MRRSVSGELELAAAAGAGAGRGKVRFAAFFVDRAGLFVFFTTALRTWAGAGCVRAG